ncbi:amino acid adenylation domain-containing protein [Saccharopolyspora sp. SCSIO 74807]|uniref:amino acid adenylation domain-containing protein n=1 Tax=Saccharopolyspora sp. SCSIO 74807 TaxID=3118084 RepID=UPI0030D20293
MSFPAEAEQLVDLVERQVAATPDAVALRTSTTRLTYAQLDRTANRWAHHLNHHAQPENPIAICASPDAQLFALLLATLKTNTTYLPVDPHQPDERIHHILHQTNPPLVLTDPTHYRRIRALAPSGTTIQTRTDPPAHESTKPPRTRHPHTSTYIVYTSGSTGRPKGITLTEATIRNPAEFQLGRGGGRRTGAQLSSIGFDVSLLEIFVTWLSGGTLVVADEQQRQDPDALLRLLAEQQVERLYLGPALLTQLAYAWWRRPVELALSEVLVSGDALRLTGAVREFVHSLAPGAVLENQYGPSETHEATAALLSGQREHWPEAPSIGRAITNVPVYVLDEFLNPVPAGVPGEIYVAGPGLARGYVARADLTAERFVADPYAAVPGTRMYRTGDRARRRADGALEFLGRTDDQVKIRGYRVELGEVEATLAACPGVASAAVTVVEGTGGVEVLSGYVALSAPAPSVRRIREFLAEKLPDHMIPAAMTVVEDMPLNRNGKVDRRALPAPELSRPELSSEYEPARTSHEQILCHIWCTVLGLDDIGIHDDFFELGGHSLLVTQVISRIRTAFAVDLPTRTLFEHRTVAALSPLVDSASRDELPPIPRRRGEEPDLSFAQQRIWLIEQLTPGTPMYAVENLWHITGALDTTALTRALELIWHRHDALRATFRDEHGSPRQHPRPAGELPVPVADLSHLSPAEAEAAAKRFVEQDAAAGFDLGTGPLLRARLFRVRTDDHLLMINFHHIAVDGWSMRVLWQEFTAAYEAFRAGAQPRLPQLPVDYADYADWQRRWLEGEQAQQQLRFWREELDGADFALELPTDHDRPAALTGRGQRVHFSFDRELTHRLRDVARQHSATMFMVLQAALDVVLARNAASTDIVTGSPVAGRSRPELEGLIGFLVNTIPLRVSWSGDPAFTEVLARVRTSALGAFSNDDVPFERIVEDLAPVRDLARNPLFQVCFVFDNSLEFEAPAELAVEQVATEPASTRFDLELLVDEYPDEMRGFLGFSVDLFDESTARRFLEHFRNVLNHIAEDPECRLSRIPMLGTEQRHTLLAAFNRQNGFELPVGRDLASMVEHQVAATPDAIALRTGTTQLTYAELDRAANQWAHHLKQHSTRPETPIGICTAPGPELFTLLLATLKTKTTYLPLDPHQPDDRLHHILHQTNPPLVLTHPAHQQRIEQLTPPTTTIHTTTNAPTDQPTTPPPRTHHPHTSAYIVYTSGSTGEPKGITLTARTIEHFVGWQLALDPRPRVCAQLATTGFDVSLQEFFVTVIGGGTLVVPTEEERGDADRVLRVLADNGVQRAYLPPAQLEELALAHRPGSADRQPLVLDEMIMAGEALRLSGAVRDFVSALGPDAVVENQYGSCETYKVSATVLSGDSAQWPELPSIGRPVSNVSAYVLDDFLNPAPIGVPGELYVSSPALARGYVARPDLTAERFVADPYADAPGTRMYRTGDRARWQPDGTLDFIGRTDDQVKIRGYRVEPGEVEAALTAAPGVGAAAVKVVEAAGGQTVLAGYAVPAAGSSTTADDVRKFLRSKLSDYMVPATLQLLQALPLTRNGKVDRAALPEPVLRRPELSSEYTPPRSSHEEILAQLWCGVLGLDDIGVHDDFFELGGHSLLVTQITSRIRDAFAIDLPTRTLFEHRTIAALADAVEEAVVAAVAAMPEEAVRSETAPDPNDS